MTLIIGLHHFFLEMSKKCWPKFRVRNFTYQQEILFPPQLKSKNVKHLLL
jgi:hypothetical protein